MHTTAVSSTGSTLSVMRWPGTDPGRSAILIHGLASNARTWGDVAALLNEHDIEVVALDQRSHGESEVTDEGYDFATYAADVAAVVRQCGLSQPVVVGQSWGGNVALEYGVRHPGACRAVVGIDGGAIELADAFSTWDEAARQLAPPEFGDVRLEDMRRRLQSMHPDWPPTGIEATLANLHAVKDGLVQARLPRQHHMAILRSLFEHRPRQLVERLQVPAFLLAARAGPTPERAVDWFPNTHIVDGDHDLHVQQPKLVADFIRKAARWE